MKSNTKSTKTSQTVIESGLYSSDCCNREQVYEAGDTFTRCLSCMGLCRWDLESEAVTTEELEHIEAIAA
jgi:hypothetical protein